MNNYNFKTDDKCEFREVNHPKLAKGYYLVDEYGHVFSKNKEKRICQTIFNNGYEYYLLCGDKDNSTSKFNRKNVSVHSIVAWAFLGAPPADMKEPTVDHIDGDKNNNHYTNLRWMELSDNVKYKPHLTKYWGENSNTSCNLSNENAVKLINRFNNGENIKELAEDYKVSTTVVKDLIHGKVRKKLFEENDIKPVSTKKQGSLNEQQVIEICEALMRAETEASLAKKYNVSIGPIDAIRRHLSWKHITEKYDFKSVKLKHSPKVTPDLARTVIDMLNEGKSHRYIAKILDISHGTVMQIKNKYMFSNPEKADEMRGNVVKDANLKLMIDDIVDNRPFGEIAYRNPNVNSITMAQYFRNFGEKYTWNDYEFKSNDIREGYEYSVFGNFYKDLEHKISRDMPGDNIKINFNEGGRAKEIQYFEIQRVTSNKSFRDVHRCCSPNFAKIKKIFDIFGSTVFTWTKKSFGPDGGVNPSLGANYSEWSDEVF